MPEPDRSSHNSRSRKGKSRGPIALVTVLLLAAAAAYFFFPRPEPSGPPATPFQQGGTGRPELNAPPAVNQPALQEQPGLQARQPETTAATEEEAGQCARLARGLHDFFRQADQEDYLPQFGLTTPLQAHLITLAEQLLANPPVVTRETDDLYTVLKNTAHFYRILGKDNIRLLKMILEREGDKIEEFAAHLYHWLTAEGCQEELLPFSPPLAGIYDYAGFFLNTLGGRAYLFRRDARTRLLVTYYAVLIVDRANGQGINRHGIDIGPVIPQLIQEIESSSHLRDKESYLERLYRLQESLPHPTGGTR